MRAFLGLIAMALTACGGSGFDATAGMGAGAGNVAADSASGASAGGLASGGAVGFSGAVGIAGSASGIGGSEPLGGQPAAGSGSAGAPVAQGGSSGAPQAGSSSAGEAATAGAPAAGSGGAANGGSAGVSDIGVGAIVVSWTVGGVSVDGGVNNAICGCVDQFGNGIVGVSGVVLSYGRQSEPLDSGASSPCMQVNLQKQGVPAADLNIKIQLARAFTQNPGYSSPDYVLDPAVTFTTTITANQTTHVVVDFPATGADGATYWIVP